jgi:hypothetical protein
MGKGRLPLGHTGDTLSALGFGILLPSGRDPPFLRCGHATHPTAASIGSRFYARDKRAKGVSAIVLSWAGVPALAAVTLHRGPSFIGHGTLRKGRQTKRAVGRIGDWFVSVGGERLPCVHTHWSKPWPEYSDPEARPGLLDYDRHTAVIASKKRVVLQLDDEPKTNAGGKTILMRKAYVGVFEVDGVTLDETGLRFRFVRRIHELK